MDKRVKSFVIATLRRGTYRWPGRYLALKDAKVARNAYTCAMCPEGVIHPKKNIQLDHIVSVVPVTGWDSFDGFIERLYCPKEGYQVLCREHHEIKTTIENQIRKTESNKKK